MNLSYTGLEQDIIIPVIKSNSKLRFKVDINDDFNEGSMAIYYLNEYGEISEFTIIGYFMKGHNDIINVRITNYDESLKIESKSYFY